MTPTRNVEDVSVRLDFESSASTLWKGVGADAVIAIAGSWVGAGRPCSGRGLAQMCSVDQAEMVALHSALVTGPVAT